MTERFSSEIRLVFKRKLPTDLGNRLENFYGHPSKPPLQLASSTSLKAAQTTVSKAVYAVEAEHSIFLFVPEDSHTLVVFLERTEDISFKTFTNESSIVQKRSNERIESIRRFAKENRNRITVATVDVTWGAMQMFRAERKSFRTHLIRSAKAHVLARLSVPVSAVLVALALNLDISTAMKTFLSATIAIAIAIFLEALLEEKFKYESTTA